MRPQCQKIGRPLSRGLPAFVFAFYSLGDWAVTPFVPVLLTP